MKFIFKEPMVEYGTEVLNILQATYIGDYKIKILFDNEHSEVVDFENFINSSTHPSIKKYSDIQLFKQFSVVNGNLNWNNYDMIFPIRDLYDNAI